jgi:hypothetical protein
VVVTLRLNLFGDHAVEQLNRATHRIDLALVVLSVVVRSLSGKSGPCLACSWHSCSTAMTSHSARMYCEIERAISSSCYLLTVRGPLPYGDAQCSHGVLLGRTRAAAAARAGRPIVESGNGQPGR